MIAGQPDRVLRTLASGLALVAALGATGCPGVHIDGPPELEAGTGVYAFEPIEPGDGVQIETLLQGGSYLPLGLRVRNMDPRRMDCRTETFLAEDGTELGEPLQFEITLLRGEEGDWVYAGLPIQVIPGDVLGVRLRIDVTLTDRDGRTAFDSVEMMPE